MVEAGAGAAIQGAGAVIQGVVNAGKAIYGGIQYKKGSKELEKALSQIKYSRPDEYGEIMNLLKGRVTGMDSRRESAEQRVRSDTAANVTGVSQLADSPVAALGAYGGLKNREQQAISDLGIEYEQMKDQATMGVVQGLEMGAGYSDKEQYYNDMYKKMVRANMASGKMTAGMNMMGGGIEGMGAAGMDYAGTRYLGGLYGAGAGETKNPWSPESANVPLDRS